jgi:LuxR family maltose regulon positive regulatory protein
MLTALLNEITTVGDDLVLVLDDYHVIDSKSVDDVLTFVLEHQPPQMHLLVATREDPLLPLARLRARGQLTELRAADLRFTVSEAAEFLGGVMALDLSAEDIAVLEARTEGWISGLLLAALSMRGREDVPGFIKAFAGDNRYIVDYLVEEVLGRQPERTRGFLLQTSILDRLSGPLCDAVTGQEEGDALLSALERGNLFVIPLDDNRHWYRYHHLFADVLFARLTQEQPDQVSTLHRRASEWYEQNGLRADAIRHALAAQDFEYAANLVELAWPAMDGLFQSAVWLGWAKALPDDLVRARPVLSVGYAWALLNDGELEAGVARLRDAERWLDTTADGSEQLEVPSSGMVVVDEVQFRSLPASIVTAHAFRTVALGDVSGTVEYAGRALDLLSEGDHLRRGQAAAILGLARWASGDLEAAHRALAEGMANFRKAGNFHFAISGTYGLADIRIAQGRLREAIRIYERTLRLALEQGEPALRGTAELYLGLGDLHRERGNLEAATQRLRESEELGEQAALTDWPSRWRRVQARMKEAQGDLDGALDLLDEAERLHHRGPVPDARPIAASKTRVWVAQGRLAEARGWVRERGLSAQDALSYLREFEHVTLARILMAEYRRDGVERSIHDATGLLERLLQAAEEGGRTGSVIEILTLQALAYEAQGDIPLALPPLERALTLAEPEGYIRIFVDEGRPMARLLSEAAARGIMPYYTGKLLAVSEAEEHESEGKSYLLPAQPSNESLSKRELEVLQLVAKGLSNREIGERLFLALDTVKGHNRRIYGKLEVRKRT